MILLDTNAVLFLIAGHRRSRPLAPHVGRLRFSPIVLLELALLQEIGRGRFTTDDPVTAVARDPRWRVDDPALGDVIACAVGLTWTRDPFDRLIAAHALHRGWRLATSDAAMLDNLPGRATFAL